MPAPLFNGTIVSTPSWYFLRDVGDAGVHGIASITFIAILMTILIQPPTTNQAEANEMMQIQLAQLPSVIGGGWVLGGHSMTSSARARSEGGISIPRALAVARFIRNSNLIGSAIGRSDGFSPLRIRPT
jgi:hypothetical protein